MPMYAIKIPPTVLDAASFWMREWSRSWRQEVPMVLHSREVDPSGAPQWHPEFARWLTDPDSRTKYGSNNKLRTTRAFRRLRKVCVREYEVLYRLVVLQQSHSEVAIWLTERAIRNGKPERYDESAVLLIAYSAADKVRSWW